MKRWQLAVLAALLLGCVVAGSFYLLTRNRTDESNPGTAQEITGAQVAQHNAPASCWLIIGSKVFNATAYLAQHPESDIASNCGGNLQSTDKKVIDALGPFYIGLLVP